MRWIVQAVRVTTTPNGKLVQQVPTFELPACLGLYTEYSARETARGILSPFPEEEVSITVTAPDKE